MHYDNWLDIKIYILYMPLLYTYGVLSLDLLSAI